MSGTDVIGREGELDQVEEFLVASSVAPAVLVFSSAAGVGKTALWEEAVERAGRLGHRVLTHRSIEAEAGFAFAGLADLVGPVFGDVADDLVSPRRRALEMALLLADAGTEPDRHAVALGLLDAVRALADGRPVVLAIEDLQWLDAFSAM